MQIVETEIASLLDQLELVRKEKHRMEEARGKEAKQRDEQIEELVSEKTNLKETLREMNDKLSRQADELKQTKQEMVKLEAGLFRATSEAMINCAFVISNQPDVNEFQFTDPRVGTERQESKVCRE